MPPGPCTGGGRILGCRAFDGVTYAHTRPDALSAVLGHCGVPGHAGTSTVCQQNVTTAHDKHPANTGYGDDLLTFYLHKPAFSGIMTSREIFFRSSCGFAVNHCKHWCLVAEGEGFEPPVPLRVLMISSHALSASSATPPVKIRL